MGNGELVLSAVEVWGVGNGEWGVIIFSLLPHLPHLSLPSTLITNVILLNFWSELTLLTTL